MAKELKIIDLNLFSGSSDTFRTAVGGFWQIVSSSEGSAVQAVPYDGENIVSDFITSIEFNLDLKEEINEEVLIPNTRVPVRMIGDPNNIKSDNYWRKYLLGGTFGSETLRPIFNTDTFDTYFYKYESPYTQAESNLVPTNVVTDIAQVSYDYNHYIREYESHIANEIQNERLFPNMYLLKMFQIQSDSADYEIDADIREFVTIDNIVQLPESIVSMVPNMERYYSSSVVVNTLSESIGAIIDNKLQNILIDYDEYISGDSVISLMEDSKEVFPYYMKFSFPTEDLGTLGMSFAENSYTPKFLKVLKETFSSEIDSLIPNEVEYAIESNFISGNIERSSYSEVIDTQNKTLRSVDLLDLIAYSHNNFLSLTDNCYFLGKETPERMAAMDTTGSYRYFNTISSLACLQSAVELMTPLNENIESLEDLYDLQPETHEVVAYRIEKIGGPPTGDSQTQNTLQNFWIFNSPNDREMDFYDSQIKYDSDYTYNVYAYIVTSGIKYNFSDLRVSRRIGTTEVTTPSPTSAAATISPTTEYNCLEFYDPITNEPIEQIFSTDNALTASNQAATEAQIVDQNRYLADFYLNYEPTLLLQEVPLMSKTLKCLDNPANRLTISPYQYMDSSQRVGFLLDYESYYDESVYPSPVTTVDEENKIAYLHANDLLEDQFLPKESISRQRFIEIYRLENKPTQVSDFADNLLRVLDLGIPDTKQTLSAIHFSDQIKTNKLYYYLFKVLNEEGMQSHLSDIYEAQLVNDGGYLYSIFNTFYEEELEEEVFNNPSVSFKKVIQLQPNISQILLNTDDADFNDTAQSQLGNVVVGTADELIWDKTFKIRTTSKKTGKKIDLNITYKLESD